jgi:hypothetical protein
MKSIRFFPFLIFAILLAACAPAMATDVPLPTPGSNPTAEYALLTWGRSGGFAGFCDQIVIRSNFEVAVSNCKSEADTRFQLTESQIAQLNDWLDRYQPIDYTRSDPATADAMTVSLTLAGRGDQVASDEVVQNVLWFASELAAQAQANLNPPPEKGEAEQALRDFLNALNAGDYILGAKLYGGDTEILQTWNPDIQDDLPAWLERACTQNGLVCMAPRTVTYRGLDSESNYQFIVEFTNSDGALFVQGPCCGEESGATFSRFVFRVKKIESGYVVLDLPPYVP